jgi:hypothetical protein
MLATAVGLATFGYAAQSIVGAAATLGLSGLGAGLLQTLGPAVAAAAVGTEEKGDAMAAYGTVRTTAMFAAPLATAAAVLVAPISTALLVVGSLLALPALAARSLAGGAEDAPEAR